MAAEQGRVSRERALSHDSRVTLLEALQAAPEPLDAAGLAEAVGLHVNTVRSHLRLLEQAGLVRRQAEPRTQPGRPRVLYTAAAPADADGGQQYQLMARMLASFVASSVPDPAAAAEEIGRQWGRHLVPAPEPFTTVSAEDGLEVLLDLLDKLGFAPRPGADPGEVELRHCPFREVAKAHPEVACSLHLGLMRGAVTEADAPVAIADLLPFVDAHRCVAHVTSAQP